MSQSKNTAEKTLRTNKPRRFVFVLLDNFSLLSFASALDCLRIANRKSTSPIYEWTVIGEGGETMKCSTHTVFNLDDDLIDLHRLAAIPKDVNRINQIETIVDLYNLKLSRTSKDANLSEEDRNRKMQALEHLMEKDVEALGGERWDTSSLLRRLRRS